MRKNSYWRNFKNKNIENFPFDKIKKNTKDYQYIGNIKADYKKILTKISKIEKQTKPSFIVNSDKKLKKAKLHDRIQSFRDWIHKGANKVYSDFF